MKIWLIVRKDIRHYLSDRKSLLLMLLMPVILTAILGSALSGIMNGEANSFPEITVAIHNGDTGSLGKMLEEQVLQSESIKKKVHIKKATTADEAENMVKDKQADVGVMVPTGYSQEIQQGKAPQIRVLTDQTKSTQGAIIQSIVTSFASRVSTVAKSTTTALEDLGQKVPMEMQTIVPQLVGDMQNIASHPGTEVTGGAVGKKAVTGMQYYAAAMLAMFLLFNMVQGAKSILHERSMDTLPRLQTTPTRISTILIGKYLGVLAFSLTQFVIFVLATRLFFGVDWGNNLGQVAALGGVYAFAVSGLSILLASLSRREQEVDTIGAMGIQVMAILGGSMLPLSIFPDAMVNLAKVTPNYWALNPLLDIMTGVEWKALALPVFILFAFGAVSLLLGTLRLKAR